MRQYKIPNYAELAVNKVFPKVKDQILLKKYLPEYSEKEYPEKDFFYNILGTLFPKELEEIIKSSRKQRALNENSNKDELIKMTPEIYNEIVGLLSFPSK